MNFIDYCELEITAGNGGNGIISFRHEKFASFGGPDGGNGGNGGNIYLEGTSNLNTLGFFSHKKFIKAENGQNGKGKKQNGKFGKNLILKVPFYTKIINKNNNYEIGFVTKNNPKILVANGGKGGRGNYMFRSSTNQAPKLCENGELGVHKSIILELKLLADVGFIGYPNAGKSTLLNALTNAKSTVGSYKFTTLRPILGELKHQKSKLILADIPGIIEGASNNKGLGLQFLRHIENCKILLFILDFYDDPLNKYKILVKELKNYNLDLLNKKHYILVNKTENISDSEKREFEKSFKKKVFFISALYSKNLLVIKNLLSSSLVLKNIIEIKYENYEIIKKITIDNDILNIKKEQNVYYITSKKLKQLINRIPQNSHQNILRFNQKLENLNFFKELKKQGIKKNDLINIYGYEFKLK